MKKIVIITPPQISIGNLQGNIHSIIASQFSSIVIKNRINNIKQIDDFIMNCILINHMRATTINKIWQHRIN